MTLASKITLTRLVLVPVFAAFAVYYGYSVQRGVPQEWARWTALTVFVIACVSDGVDGWIARHFHQRSQFGAFLDPLADKTLLLSAIVILANVDWGPDGWRIPPWFMWLVIVRDVVIVGGLWILKSCRREVAITPHWSGKLCTVAQMFTLGWVMLKIVPFSPVYPSLIASVFCLWSAVDYLRTGWRILQRG